MSVLPYLLEQLKAGDRSTFERVYLEYSPKVYRFTGRYICNREDAEEIVQDVFIRLWNARTTLDTSRNLDNYLFTITRNIIFNRHRSKVNEQHFQTVVLSGLEQEYDMPEEAIVARDLLHYIDNLVGQFPPRQREVFNLSRKQMLSHREIAKKLGMAEKTVKVHIYNALVEIKKQLERNGT